MATDVQIAALRAALAGDIHAFETPSGAAGLDQDEDFAVLMAVAFVIAARRRFSPTWSGSDVIRFVGQLRARDHGEYSDIDAEAAEHMLLSALSGNPLRGQFDEFAKGYAQVALLTELTSELDADQLDVLVASAREQADHWLTG